MRDKRLVGGLIHEVVTDKECEHHEVDKKDDVHQVSEDVDQARLAACKSAYCTKEFMWDCMCT